MASAVIDLSLESSDEDVPANSRPQRKRAAAAPTDDDDRKMPGSAPASRTGEPADFSRQWSDGRRKARRRGDRRPSAPAAAAASASSAPNVEDGSSPDRKMTSAEVRALGAAGRGRARERRENRSRGNDSNSNGSGTSPGGSDSDDALVAPRRLRAASALPRRPRAGGSIEVINVGDSPDDLGGAGGWRERVNRRLAMRREARSAGRSANSRQDGTEFQIRHVRPSRARSVARSTSFTGAAAAANEAQGDAIDAAANEAQGDATRSRSSSNSRRTSRRLAALAARRPSHLRVSDEATAATGAGARPVDFDIVDSDEDLPSFSELRRRALERRRNDTVRAETDRRRQRWTEAVLSGRPGASASSASASSAFAASASVGSSAVASMSAATAGYNARPSAAPAAAAAASSSSSTEWECSRCTLLNPTSARTCAACHNLNPSMRSSSGSGASGNRSRYQEFLSTLMESVMRAQMLRQLRERGIQDDISGMSYDELLERFGNGTENRGASKEAIAKLKVSKVRNTAKLADCDDTCVVCLERFAKGDKRKVLACSHGFHPECIDKWLNTNGVCPTCKAKVE